MGYLLDHAFGILQLLWVFQQVVRVFSDVLVFFFYFDICH